jgi:hypothetical protein
VSEGVLSKRQVVLDLDSAYGGPHGLATFKYQDEDGVDASHNETILALSQWVDFGHPGKITVTIEPGDKLNGGPRQ